MGVRRGGDRRVDRDLVVLDELEQALFERAHPVVVALGDHLVDLRRLVGIGDPFGDPSRVHQDLVAGDHPAVAGTDEALTDDPLERPGQREPDLSLLLGWEEVHHAVHGLGRVHGVERRQDQVAGLGRLHRRPHGLGVPHLADQDHVGVLPQGGSERREEALGVAADLALVDRRDLVAEKDLDRVLDRHDVALPGVVEVLDHRGQGRGLARAGRAGYQDQAARLVREPSDHLGQTHLVEARPADPERPGHGRHRATLAKHVDAEPSDAGERVGEIDLAGGLEPFHPFGRDDGRADRLHLVVGQVLTFEREQGPGLADLGRRADLEMQVRAVALDQHREPAVELVHDAAAPTGRGELDRMCSVGVAGHRPGGVPTPGLDHLMAS